MSCADWLSQNLGVSRTCIFCIANGGLKLPMPTNFRMGLLDGLMPVFCSTQPHRPDGNIPAEVRAEILTQAYEPVVKNTDLGPLPIDTSIGHRGESLSRRDDLG
jgi:hypothetical protein